MQAAQQALTTALEQLEIGNEVQARSGLLHALKGDPNNRLAQNLLKQIDTDPVALLGKESFAYRVQPGESLSRIAQRFLGDLHLFYALARYNDIPVPRHLQGGQLIKVPGKAPPPSPAPSDPAAPPTPPAPPATPDAPAPDAARDAELDRQARISAGTRAARRAFARQDLTAAIRQWDIVLELDPANSTAQLERKKAVELRDKLVKVK